MSTNGEFLKVRASKEDQRRWSAAASRNGLTLSALTRLLLNAAERGEVRVGAVAPPACGTSVQTA